MRNLPYHSALMVANTLAMVSSFALRASFAAHRSALSQVRLRALSTASVGSGTHRVVFMGTPACAATSLERVIKAAEEKRADFTLVGVVTQPVAPAGRSQKLSPSPVHKLAQKHNLPVLTPTKSSDRDFLETISSDWKPDLCITAAFGQYLPTKFLSIPRFGVFNIHPSALPQYRGAAPVQRSIQEGCPAKCVTVLQTIKKMDAGPILSQHCEPLGPDQNALEVLHEMFAVGTEMLLEALPMVWDGSHKMIMQDEAMATYAAKIDVRERYCHLERMSATATHNHVRAFIEWPGSWVRFKIGDNETPVKLVKTTVVDSLPKDDNEPQDRRVKLSKGVLHITCGDGSVLGVKELQLPGKKVVDAASFVNGLRKQRVEWVPIPEEGDEAQAAEGAEGHSNTSDGSDRRSPQ